jgi:hypothetical protein
MTPEQRQEAERLIEALTVPMAGKYIATDDIKKGGQMIQTLLDSKGEVKRPWINMSPKKVMAGVLACIVLGFVAGKVYTWDTIIVDCKVLGAFRIASTPFQCKMMAP